MAEGLVRDNIPDRHLQEGICKDSELRSSMASLGNCAVKLVHRCDQAGAGEVGQSGKSLDATPRSSDSFTLNVEDLVRVMRFNERGKN